MKNHKLINSFTVIIIMLSIFACSSDIKQTENNTNKQQEFKQNKELTSLLFINKVYDFGKVKQDSLISAEYSFVNTGKNQLVIESVSPDCSCTGYIISKDTVMPDDTAYIQLQLNTHDKYGKVKAYAIVIANTVDKMYKLTIKGEVYE